MTTNDDPMTDDRARELAAQLGCVLEEDVAAFAGVKPSTPRDWRERGNGPPWARVGRRILYPREQLAAWIAARVRPGQRTATAERRSTLEAA